MQIEILQSITETIVFLQFVSFINGLDLWHSRLEIKTFFLYQSHSTHLHKMTFANKIVDLLSGSKRQKLLNKLHHLIEVEERYLLKEFGIEYLAGELGVEEDVLIEILKSEYEVSFFQLLRQLRINHLKRLVSSYGEKLSLSDYVKFTGFRDVGMMLHGLKEETGLDFDDFCKYAQDVNSRE